MRAGRIAIMPYKFRESLRAPINDGPITQNYQESSDNQLPSSMFIQRNPRMCFTIRHLEFPTTNTTSLVSSPAWIRHLMKGMLTDEGYAYRWRACLQIKYAYRWRSCLWIWISLAIWWRICLQMKDMLTDECYAYRWLCSRMKDMLRDEEFNVHWVVCGYA